MKKILFIIILLFISINIFALDKGDLSAFNKLCKNVDINPKEVALDKLRGTNGGYGVYNDFMRLWNNWQLISPYTDNLNDNLSNFDTSINEPLTYLSLKSDVVLKDNSIKKDIKTIEKLIKKKDAFNLALKEINGKYIVGNENNIPKNIKKALTTLIYASVYSKKYIDKSFHRNVYEEIKNPLSISGSLINKNELLSGASLLSTYIDEVSKGLKGSKSSYYVAINTDYGIIEVSDNQDNVYNFPNSFIVIDLMGNDTYSQYYGGTDLYKKISILIDKKGNDKYISNEDNSFGAGINGYGFLIDMEGDDIYEADSFSLGVGYGGFGALIDYKGNDTYSGNVCVEGSSANGIGYFRDLEGEDKYYAYQFAQGYGGPGGVGVLCDEKGNDEYIAEDEVILYPSPQSDKHNTSMSQGAGFGSRNDRIAGGLGLLLDMEGNDKYSCGVFGQGTSYWYSLGFLLDNKGNDTYNGVWYAFGAAAHYSLAGLIDREGNDSYYCQNDFGLGHDYSIGYFEDRKGNDNYVCLNNPIGWVNANGLSLFFDLGGNDNYSKVKISDVTESSGKSYGVFLDIGGKNILPENNTDLYKSKFWMVRDNNMNPKALAFGMFR